MTAIEDSIKVEVKTEYIEEQSDPIEERYLFRYTITIVNLGESAVTLKSRYWSITDANNHNSEVRGQGVVGETPRIEPDSAYQYTSGTVMETPLGVMEGSYTMITDDGVSFKAQIPLFRLAVPGLLH
ncbi:Co2+/Mg2+ efflux protein ApaG [uncultured Shewanella sp.]|uniref:Co2+/Mg2+ efflux protein ApaG n=1 Tax=Shewanella atlantica TaxID=271099 RepID=UPI002615B63F|nr:Co2+/Mg2+ efflux protein ApaG [uncultured Shewanella sp.]